MTAAMMTYVSKPIRMRCLELCMHDVDCRVVAYTTDSDDENCALYEQNPPEETLIHASEWTLIALL